MTVGAGTETATVLFTDMVGSTVLRQTLGDDGADELRRQHDRMVREAVAAHGGREVKGTGDGFMVVFGAAAEAVTSAVAMQQAFARFNRRAPAPLGLRVGLSAGDVVWEDGDCFGTPVVEARRLCDAADSGQVLVSEIVRLLAGSRGGHGYSALPPLALKGLTDPVTAFEVGWQGDTDGEVPLPPALVGRDSLAYVGRAEERDRLTLAWKEAQAGTRQVVLVSGEPGVGKTRLVAETARAAHAAGATVLFGRCDEDMGVPYQPFVEALDGYLATARPDEVREHAGRLGGELARLLPQLVDLVTGLPEPLRADPETERYQQFEAVRAFLASLAATAPVVLVLDDLHWAAQPTLLLLRHLLRGDDNTALLVLGTYRDTDLSRSHPLAGVLADLRRAEGVDRVDLRGLPADEVAELIRAAAGHALHDDLTELAHQVWTETEGNPFFVGQVLRHLVETRAIVQDDDGHWIPGPNAGHGGLPEGVREVIGRRLSRLSDETNTLLATAAVIGREFDAALLVQATDHGSEAVFDGLEQAEEARLLVPVPGKPGRYAFTHALVRSTLYDELATTRRLRLHRKVGLALEARGGDEQLDELARHWSEAAALGETARATDYCTRAGAQAMERLAWEEAAGWYERALAAIDPDSGEHAVRAELLIALGDGLWMAGEHVTARLRYDAAIDAARRSGDDVLFARAAVGRGGRRAWVDAGLVDDDLLAVLDEALDRLPAQDSTIRAIVMGRLSSELYFKPEFHDRRTALGEAAVAMARRCGDADTIAYTLSTYHWGAWVPGNTRERLSVANELLDLARETGNREREATAWQQISIDMWELGDLDRARAALAEQARLYEMLRMAEGDWLLSVIGGALALFEGRFDDAERMMNEGLAHSQRLETPTGLQMYGVHMFAMCRARGGMENMVPLSAAMVDEYPLIPAWRTGLAYALAETGDLAGAEEQIRILAPDAFAVIPNDANWHIGVSLCAYIAEAVGAEDLAAVLYDLLAPYAEFWVCAGMPADCFGPGTRFLGLAAAATGRLDEAERLLTSAGEACRAQGSPPLGASVDVELARLLLRKGEADRACELLTACLAVCDELGMSAVRAKAEALLADA